NLHKHFEHEPDRPHWERVFAAAREVGPALFMSLLIITLSFLPVFTLEDQEGRLFRPLALTKTFAMAAAALLSVTLVPALMGWFVKGKIRSEASNPVNRWAIRTYRPILRWALRARWLVLGGAAAILVVTLLPFSRLGSEFMPPLNEGDRKSTRLNSSHVSISYAVFCLKKKKNNSHTSHTYTMYSLL